MKLIYRPIDQWPGELTRVRKSSPFDAQWQSTLELLEREVHNLQGSSSYGRRYHAEAVIQLAVPEEAIRQDGALRAGRQGPDHPGVILNIDAKAGPLRFSCDRFDTRYSDGWKSNLRAIALGLEALRKVERYGLGSGHEQYAGFQALPPGTPMPPVKMTREQAARLLSDESIESPLNGFPCFTAEQVLNEPRKRDAAYRLAVQWHHPDKGGDPEMFRRLTEARDLLQAAA